MVMVIIYSPTIVGDRVVVLGLIVLVLVMMLVMVTIYNMSFISISCK